MDLPLGSKRSNHLMVVMAHDFAITIKNPIGKIAKYKYSENKIGGEPSDI